MSIRARILVPVLVLVSVCVAALGAYVVSSARGELVSELDQRVAGELNRHAPELTNIPPPDRPVRCRPARSPTC